MSKIDRKKEKFVDLTATAREVLTRGYQTHLERRLARGAIGKPLGALTLKITKKHFDEGAQEQLVISPLSSRSITPDIYDPEIRNYYQTLAARIGNTALTNSLRIQEAIPSNGVQPLYIFSPSNGHEQILSTPDAPMHLLERAYHFAQEGLQYIQSDDSKKEVGPERTLAAVLQDKDGVIRHDFTIEMHPDLPLNGHEDDIFLISYCKIMRDEIEQAQARLDRNIQSNASEILINRDREKIPQYMAALRQAEEILAKRKRGE